MCAFFFFFFTIYVVSVRSVVFLHQYHSTSCCVQDTWAGFITILFGVWTIYMRSVKMRCRLCELFMDQLQAFSLNNSHSGPNQLHHYHQHMSAAASSALLLPQMRDMIAAYLLRGRVTDNSRNSSGCINVWTCSRSAIKSLLLGCIAIQNYYYYFSCLCHVATVAVTGTTALVPKSDVLSGV